MKWNSPEGRQLFYEWKFGERPYDFMDEATPGQISELTVAARGFLRRRNKTIYAFSDGTVQRVRGTTRLSATTLSNLSKNVAEDTYTFTRTYEPKDLRAILNEQFDQQSNVHVEDPDDSYMQEDATVPDNLAFYAAYEYDYDLQIRQDTLFHDAQISDRSNVTRVKLDAGEPQYAEGFPLITEDYMVLRTLMSLESQARR